MSTPTIQAHLSPEWKLPLVKNYQEDKLELAFLKDKNPQSHDLMIIAAETGLDIQEVKVWFEHRLAKWRQSQGLPANGSFVNA
ncbi:homeodomain-only protein-like [Centruroides vittatus]|uniref:homeodomain-only protein-like n=1 Tax=Centruroides sculpturatus TaxID=218467 RepID=UPI000C6CB055|nr:homeodomain-only protein-like [Centruroides sculpturatus]